MYWIYWRDGMPCVVRADFMETALFTAMENLRAWVAMQPRASA
jgi:hypothetical protein